MLDIALGGVLSLGSNIVKMVGEYKLEKMRGEQRIAEAKLSGQIDIGKQAIQSEGDRAVAFEGLLAKYAEKSAGWVATYNSLMRPLITTIYIALFVWVVAIELFLGVDGYSKGIITLSELSQVAWDSETQKLFNTVVSFWFTNRVFKMATSTLKSVAKG